MITDIKVQNTATTVARIADGLKTSTVVADQALNVANCSDRLLTGAEAGDSL